MKFLIAATVLMALGACRSNDLGTGVNTVDRDYSKPAGEVCKAALQSAESAEFKVLSNTHDQLGGEVLASRGDGREVRITVKSIDEKSSRVSVRLEPGDRDLANMVHERIAGNLGMGAAKTGWWFGGNSLDCTYRPDMAACMISARRTIGAMAQTSKDEECHATWCQIDGRLKDSTPIRIKMERVDDKSTWVCFTVGNSKSDDNKACVQKMKDDFETTTRPAAGSQ